MSDPFDLERFVAAQDPVYANVIAELSGGRKVTHWMWFVFPQFAGLGASAMSHRFAIGSAQEARAYVAHKVLGQRLFTCTRLVSAHAQNSIGRIFPYPDDLKFHSSMTLFAATTEHAIFSVALANFFSGQPDEATLSLLARA